MSDVQAHSEHKSHKKEYIIIFVVLAVLTILEIWVAEINGLSKMGKGSALTFLAIGKRRSCSLLLYAPERRDKVDEVYCCDTCYGSGLCYCSLS